MFGPDNSLFAESTKKPVSEFKSSARLRWNIKKRIPFVQYRIWEALLIVIFFICIATKSVLESIQNRFYLASSDTADSISAFANFQRPTSYIFRQVYRSRILDFIDAPQSVKNMSNSFAIFETRYTDYTIASRALQLETLGSTNYEYDYAANVNGKLRLF